MEWPLTVTAVVFLLAYATQVLADLSEAQAPLLELIIWAVWLVFTVDYLVNLFLAQRRWHWFVRNLHLLLIVILPVLRPLRLLRLVSFMSIVQRRAGTALRGQVVAYVVASTALLILVGALAILDAEQNEPTANITNFAEALWWACTTISTVGYGDFYPVTAVGRLVAVGLMVSGVALLGVVTATLASWLVERVSVENKATEKPELDQLLAEIRALRLEVARAQASGPEPGPPAG